MTSHKDHVTLKKFAHIKKRDKNCNSVHTGSESEGICSKKRIP